MRWLIQAIEARRAPDLTACRTLEAMHRSENFVHRTSMIEGVRESALAAGMIDPDDFDAGVRDLYRTAEADGVFCYTFFKGVGTKRQR